MITINNIILSVIFFIVGAIAHEIGHWYKAESYGYKTKIGFFKVLISHKKTIPISHMKNILREGIIVGALFIVPIIFFDIILFIVFATLYYFGCQQDIDKLQTL